MRIAYEIPGEVAWSLINDQEKCKYSEYTFIRRIATRGQFSQIIFKYKRNLFTFSVEHAPIVHSSYMRVIPISPDFPGLLPENEEEMSEVINQLNKI